MSLLTIATALFVSHLSAPSKGHALANDSIIWPKQYEPKRSKFFVHNEIEIYAKPEKVWKLLIKASEWEQWYSGASKVQLPNNADTLKNGMEFKWKTMGLNFLSMVESFEWEKYLKLSRLHDYWLGELKKKAESK